MLRNYFQREDSCKKAGHGQSFFSIDYHADICLFIRSINWRIKDGHAHI